MVRADQDLRVATGGRAMLDPKAFYAEVGMRIRQSREERTWSQEKLAQVVGLTRSSIANIECGRQRLLVHTLCSIAAALDCDLLSLLPGGEQHEAHEFTGTADDLPVAREWLQRSLAAVRKDG